MTLLRFVSLFLLISFSASAQKDYKLWLQYNTVANVAIASEYKNNLKGIVILGNSETIKIAERELKIGLSDMFGNIPEIRLDIKGESNLIIGSQSNLNAEIKTELQSDLDKINTEGFIIKSISIKNKKSHFAMKWDFFYKLLQTEYCSLKTYFLLISFFEISNKLS